MKYYTITFSSRDLWKWFVEFKRKVAIISEYLLVYPRYFDMRSRAQQVKHRTMQAAWRDACKKAGYGGMYHLRDLRKKGLTEEFLSQGENDKGGHETEAMRNHYRLIKPPKRARTTIRFERKQITLRSLQVYRPSFGIRSRILPNPF